MISCDSRYCHIAGVYEGVETAYHVGPEIVAPSREEDAESGPNALYGGGGGGIACYHSCNPPVVDNKVNNNVENHIENTVDTKVNVDVNLDLNASGLSAPVIDLHGFTTTDSLVMPQVVNQTLNGGGNEFNIDQVNNLINNATVTDPSVTYGGSLSEYPAGGFHMDAKVAGGDSKIGDSKLGDSAGAGSGVVSSADATLTQDAFTQTITTGANIQFNSLTMEVAGHNLSDGHDILSH